MNIIFKILGIILILFGGINFFSMIISLSRYNYSVALLQMIVFIFFIIIGRKLYIFKPKIKNIKLNTPSFKQKENATNKRVLEINTKVVKYLFVSLVLAYLTVLGFNHFGKLTYLPKSETHYVYNPYTNLREAKFVYTDELDKLTYTSFFDSVLEDSDTDFYVRDIAYSDGKLHDYKNRVGYYIRVSFLDYEYLILFFIFYSTLILFFTKIKIKFT